MNHLNEQELREQPLLSEEGIKTHMALMPEYLNKATYERATRKLIAAYEAERKSNRELVQRMVNTLNTLPLTKEVEEAIALAASKGITPTT